MTLDPRITPANGRVALDGLQGQVAADHFVQGTPHSIITPLADLRRSPAGARDRQLLLGADVLMLEDRAGWAYIQTLRDGYCGYVETACLGAPAAPTHIIGVRASHLYPAADVFVEAEEALSFGARVRVVDERAKFMEIASGHFVPKAHLRLIDRPFSDPATVAQQFFGTPYLWGGNSSAGIDCSGLVQAALLACDHPCPGDSDMQASLGAALSDEARLQRGDLLFWKGHVAMCVDGETLLHANAHHMATAYEPIAKAIARIAAQDGGPVTARRRP